MCKWGTYTKVELCEIDLKGLTEEQNKMRAKKLGLSERGEFVDSCIAPLVQILNDYKIRTRSSCCGHGKLDYSVIWLYPEYFKISALGYTKPFNKMLIKVLSYFVGKLATDKQMSLELKFPYEETRKENERRTGERSLGRGMNDYLYKL